MAPLSSASSVARAVRQLNVSADCCAELLKIHIAVSKLWSLLFILGQGSATNGPRAGCGPRLVLANNNVLRPAVPSEIEFFHTKVTKVCIDTIVFPTLHYFISTICKYWILLSNAGQNLREYLSFGQQRFLSDCWLLSSKSCMPRIETSWTLRNNSPLSTPGT